MAFNLFIIIQVIISILLIAVILMQSSKGGGLAGTFGGASVGMMFGVRRTADFLTKATQILAALFLIFSLVINLFFLPRGGTTESVIQKGSVGTTPPAATSPQLPPAQPPVTPPQE